MHTTAEKAEAINSFPISLCLYDYDYFKFISQTLAAIAQSIADYLFIFIYLFMFMEGTNIFLSLTNLIFKKIFLAILNPTKLFGTSKVHIYIYIFRYSMVRQHDIPLGNVSQNGGPGGKKVNYWF
jgi:hypothetical protein